MGGAVGAAGHAAIWEIGSMINFLLSLSALILIIALAKSRSAAAHKPQIRCKAYLQILSIPGYGIILASPVVIWVSLFVCDSGCEGILVLTPYLFLGSIIIWPVATACGWRLYRKEQYKKAFACSFGIIAVHLLLLFGPHIIYEIRGEIKKAVRGPVDFYHAREAEKYRRAHPPKQERTRGTEWDIPFKDIPPELIKVADDYIIAKVGEDYFRKNYVLAEESKGYTGQYSAYRIIYNYLPLEKIGASSRIIADEAKVYVTVPDSAVPGSLSVPYFIAIIENGKIIEPIVTKDHAITIAKEYLAQRVPMLKATLSEDKKHPTVFYMSTRSARMEWTEVPEQRPAELFKKWIWRINFQVPDNNYPDCMTEVTARVNAVTGSVEQARAAGYYTRPDITKDRDLEGLAEKTANSIADAYKYLEYARQCTEMKSSE